MNRTQIAQIYDEFPEGKRDMPREQFIREVTSALDPDRVVAEVDAIVQRRRMGGANKAAIDRALGRS